MGGSGAAPAGRDAVVVGGGIGGMAAAIALARSGWRVDVLERAPAFDEVGAGLSLWPNGLRALDVLGIGDRVRDLGTVETQAGIRNPAGRWLSRTDTAELQRRYGPMVMVHRAVLSDLLRREARGVALHTGCAVRRVRDDGGRTLVEHEHGTVPADLVVAADGIHSTVRAAVWPQAPAPRFAGYTAWRMVVDAGEPLPAGGETWGRGLRVGFAPLHDGRTYLFAVANAPERGVGTGGELARVRRRFAGWHDPVPRLLDAATEDAVLRHDIYELPPLRSYAAGRVALLGDAAHAMTPNLGQGANQAFEDAVALAALLARHPTVPAALAAYDRVRRPRTSAIARQSRRLGAVAQWRSPPAVALRDAAMRCLPARALLRALGPVLAWQPPLPP